MRKYLQLQTIHQNNIKDLHIKIHILEKKNEYMNTNMKKITKDQKQKVEIKKKEISAKVNLKRKKTVPSNLIIFLIVLLIVCIGQISN